MKLLFSPVLFLFLSFSFAQAQNWQWAQKLGNIKSDKITSIKTDGQGYIYIAGYFSTSTPIGTNALILNFTANTNSKEAFIAKLDSTGYCYWAKSGGQYFDDRVLGMDVDSAGFSVITGTYWEGSGINFPPLNITGSTFGWGDQCFIVKFDPNGNPVWGNFVCSNTGDDQGYDVATDKAGNHYVIGFMTGATLYCGGAAVTATNPNTTGLYNHCFWLTKVNANGVFQWAKTFGHLPWDTSHFKYIERDIAVCVDEKDGIYITGGFDNTAQFGTSSFTSGGGYDCFVMKYDSNGNYKWATQAGSNKDDWSNGICSDKNGSIYITGEFRDSLIMDTILVKNYDKRDVYVIKVDALTGKPIWGKRAGGNLGGERGNDVWADDKCNVYVCGDINDGGKFGDNIIVPSGNSVQAFVAKISPEGKWTWAITGGGLDSNDRCNALAKGKGNQLYVAGYFRSSANYGPTALTSVGSSDGFFARIYDSSLNKGGKFKLNPPHDSLLCDKDTVHLTVPAHEHFEITPSIFVQFNADSTHLIFSPTTTTTYTMTGYSQGICKDFDTLTFTMYVAAPFYPLPAFDDLTICDGESILYDQIPVHENLTVAPMTGLQFNTDSSAITFAPASTTTYTLTVSVGGICPKVDKKIVTMNHAPNPVADFYITPQVALLLDPTFTFVNTSTGICTYQWFLGNTLISSSFSPQRTENAVGEYCYKLLATSLGGCKDSVTHCATLIKDERVFFPNAFSPNRDNVNDEFKPLLFNIDFSKMSDYSFVVANRLGSIVFSAKNPGIGWNGTYKGVKCDLGVYYYICKFTTPEGKVYHVKGDVTLIY
ncbi:hypothetical protein EMGBS15_16140 [Filimonas sp.]|nr:hypothetical protein EMGBS15_16140 [Filimonas sp.]